MKTIKAFFARLFAEKWTYHDNMSVRVHKETGKVEYWHVDPWGGSYEEVPQFSDIPLWTDK